MNDMYLPALRGIFGDWTYYSCLMSLNDLAERISYADDIRSRKALSDWLQRVLDEERAGTIAEYLKKQNDRFFNSLVVAVYGGDPSWFAAGRITSTNSQLNIDDLDKTVCESIGFLHLTGKEKLFAIDGQHRLAGIKQAVNDKPEIGQEMQSLLLVGHKRTTTGLQRTRRLFTTLNKTVKPVSTSEIIALDEDDVMAITTRRLVDEHAYFQGNRIAFNPKANLATGDYHSLTSIVSLYQILCVLFSKINPRHKLADMKYYRPSDVDLDNYYEIACTYFNGLNNHFRPLQAYFAADDFSKLVREHRGETGGNVMFRPIGLLMMTEVIAALSKNRKLDDAIAQAAQLPQMLSCRPYKEVLWSRRTGMTTRKALARDLLLYMIGALPERKHENVGVKYARALDCDPNNWEAVLAHIDKTN